MEGNWQPATVMMTGPQHEIYDFKEKQPAYGILLDTLLRGHGGIFDHAVNINESSLARRLRKSDFEREVSQEEIVQVQRMLQQMEKLQLLRYQPSTEWPLLTLTESRSLYPSLNIDLLQRLLKRRLQALEQLTNYAVGESCRSAFWRIHFTEETHAPDCGTCDICKRKNRKAGDERSRKFWHSTLLKNPNSKAAYMLKHFPVTQQALLVETLRIMLDEGCIIENENQTLSWVGESFLQ